MVIFQKLDGACMDFKDPDTHEIERILASTQSQGTHADACREIQACDGNHYEPNLYQNNFGLEVKGLTESSKSRLAEGWQLSSRWTT